MKNNCFKDFKEFLMDNKNVCGWIETASIITKSPILRIITRGNNPIIEVWYIDEVYYITDEECCGFEELATSTKEAIEVIKNFYRI